MAKTIIKKGDIVAFNWKDSLEQASVGDVSCEARAESDSFTNAKRQHVVVLVLDEHTPDEFCLTLPANKVKVLQNYS